MPRCGATFDENNVPPLDKGGPGGGKGKPSHPALRDRVEPSQESTFAPPLPWRGFSEQHPQNTPHPSSFLTHFGASFSTCPSISLSSTFTLPAPAAL